MQALIDFDGWRKWKDLAALEEANKESKKGETKADQKAALRAMFSQPPKTKKEKEEKERELEDTGTEHVDGPAGGEPVNGRPKSPNDMRRPEGKTDMTHVIESGIDGKRDSGANGSISQSE